MVNSGWGIQHMRVRVKKNHVPGSPSFSFWWIWNGNQLVGGTSANKASITLHRSTVLWGRDQHMVVSTTSHLNTYYYTGTAYIRFLFTRQALFTNDRATFYERVHAKHQYRYFNFLSLKSQMILSHHTLHHSLISHFTNACPASCSVRSYQEHSKKVAIRTVLEC